MRIVQLAVSVLIIVQDERRMARFAQYAMVASEEALNDSGWFPKKEEDLESTVWRPGQLFARALLTMHQGVYMGSGIGSLDDVYDTTVAYEKGVSAINATRIP